MARNGLDLSFYDNQEGQGSRSLRRAEYVADPSWTTTPEFKALQAEWYAKLKAEGFTDIEAHGGDPTLHDDNLWQAPRAADQERRRIDAEETGTAEFFTLVQHWLDRGRWTTRAERWWWNEWAHGATFREVYQKHPVRPKMADSRFAERMRELRGDMLAARGDEPAVEDDATIQQLRSREAVTTVPPEVELQGLQAGDLGGPER